MSRKNERIHNESTAIKDVPMGLESVIYAAAVDGAFCRALLEDPLAAVEQRQMALRSSETAMLRAIPRAQLQASIDAVDTAPDNLRRRTFLRAVAAGALTLSAAEALQGCSSTGDTGSRPYPYDKGNPDQGMDSKASDLGPAPTGIRPDLPPSVSDASKKRE